MKCLFLFLTGMGCIGLLTATTPASKVELKPANYVRLEANGVLWEAKTFIVRVTPDGFSIMGERPDHSFFDLEMKERGNSIFELLNGSYVNTALELYNYQHSDPLTLTILEHNKSRKYIRGTFSFRVRSFFEENRSVQINNGEFGIIYP
jgi:hypothetical protein